MQDAEESSMYIGSLEVSEDPEKKSEGTESMLTSAASGSYGWVEMDGVTEETLGAETSKRDNWELVLGFFVLGLLRVLALSGELPGAEGAEEGAVEAPPTPPMLRGS